MNLNSQTSMKSKAQKTYEIYKPHTSMNRKAQKSLKFKSQNFWTWSELPKNLWT